MTSLFYVLFSLKSTRPSERARSVWHFPDSSDVPGSNPSIHGTTAPSGPWNLSKVASFLPYFLLFSSILASLISVILVRMIAQKSSVCLCTRVTQRTPRPADPPRTDSLCSTLKPVAQYV